MSNPEDKAGAAAQEERAFEKLEAAVDAAAARLADLGGRLGEATSENQEMKELLRQFTQGEEDPSRLLTRMEELEDENRELLVRLKKGREGVERLLARIRFLEGQS